MRPLNAIRFRTSSTAGIEQDGGEREEKIGDRGKMGNDNKQTRWNKGGKKRKNKHVNNTKAGTQLTPHWVSPNGMCRSGNPSGAVAAEKDCNSYVRKRGDALASGSAGLRCHLHL